MIEAHEGLKDYFRFYNGQRYHQALDYKTPQQIYKPNQGVIHISTAIHKEKEKKYQKKKEKITTTINILV